MSFRDSKMKKYFKTLNIWNKTNFRQYLGKFSKVKPLNKLKGRESTTMMKVL